MKYLKFNMLFFSLFLANFLTAQNTADIIGKWHNEEGGAVTKCYLFEHQGKLHGLVYYYKDKNEAFSLEKELKAYEVEKIEDLTSEDIFQHLSEFVWFKDFEKKDKEWKGQFIYTEKGESSMYDAALKPISPKALKVSFKYWGIWDSSSWTRDDI